MIDLFPSDTPLHIRKKQIEMVLSKSNEERLRQCGEMSDFSYYQALKIIKKRLNSDDEQLIKLAYIETCYKDDLKKEFLDFIKTSFHQKNK